jgi:hypothetical protein
MIPFSDLDSRKLKWLLIGPPYVACENGSAVKIGKITSLIMHGGESHYVRTLGETTYTPAGLDANQDYHLYASSGSGILEFAHFDKDNGPPDAGLVRKDAGVASDKTHRYLCSFRTDGSGDIIPFRWVRGRYLYDFSRVVSNGLRVLSDGDDTTFTDVVLSGFVPQHARIVLLQAIFFPKLNNLGLAEIRTKGGTGNTHQLRLAGVSGLGPTSDDSVSMNIEMLCDSDRTIQYQVSDPDDSLAIHCLGYSE